MDPMFGMSVGACAGTIASHRGVDLGPLRFDRSRHIHPIERIAPLHANQVPWQATQLATGPPVR